jgi:hypothetical protein
MTNLFDITSIPGAVVLPSNPETPITVEDLLALAILFGSDASETSEEGGEVA